MQRTTTKLGVRPATSPLMVGLNNDQDLKLTVCVTVSGCVWGERVVGWMDE